MREFLPSYLGILESVIALTAVLYVIELAIPAMPAVTLSKRVANWLYMPFVLAWILILQSLFGSWNAGVVNTARGGVLTRLFLWHSTVVGGVALTLVYAVAWDVWQYWIHRWQHSSALLWETHKVHHSEETLNAGTQARAHASQYVLYMITYAPVLILFGGFSPPAIVTMLMFRVWGFVNHANVRVSFGPLTSVIAGPQWHRIHHSRRREHADRNYAALFPFIDRVFGTYYAPTRDEYPPTGLASVSESTLRQLTISPFAHWYRAALSAWHRR